MPNLNIKIPITEIIIPYEGLNFKYLEEKIMEALKETGKRVLEASIKAVDDMEETKRSSIMKNKGIGRKYLETAFGTIRYSRRRYQESGAKGGRYLADEKLGIEKGKESSPVRELLENELSVMCGSYRKASGFLGKYFTYGKSHESIRQGVLREGAAMRGHQEAELENIRVEACKGEVVSDKSVPEVAYVEVDGTGIKIQKSRRGKKIRNRRREVKLGILYSGHERRYAGGTGKQKKLKEKHVYASLENADRFMEKFSLICEKVMNISRARIKLFGGDGAAWIKEGRSSYFHDSVYELCKFHLQRAINQAFGYSGELGRKLRWYLKLDNIDGGIKFIDRIINMTGAKNRERKERLKELRGYIESNREGINAIERLKKNLSPKDRELVGTMGAIESNIYSAVTQRMKKKRMSWSETGAESMLQLICRMMNYGGLEDWYSKQRYEKIDLKKEDYSRLAANTVWAGKEENPLPARMPALYGPHQDKVWVRVLREIKDGLVAGSGEDVEERELKPKAAVN
jgi:hypothetical protein